MSPDRTASAPRRIVVLAATALVMLGAASPHAAAAAPRQQGWWTVTNQSRVDLPPEIDPGAPPATAPAPPAPPDVPEDGLLVQGGPEDSSDLPGGVGGQSAYAALVYELPLGQAADTLALSTAEDAASTPFAPVRLCPLTTNSIQPAQGGPMSDAPGFDCTTELVAEPSEDGNSYEWPVAELESDGILAVALLAAEPDDRIVFAAPDDASLTTTPAARSTTPTTAAPSDGVAELGGPAGSGRPAASAAPPTGGAPGVPGAADPAPSPAPAPSEETASAPAPVVPDRAPIASASSTISEEFDGMIAVVVVLGLGVGAGLWARAGRAQPGEDDGATSEPPPALAT